MCGTALILYPGEYRGILEPWEHYIPLERDGSNDSEVVKLLKDEAWLEALTGRALRRVEGDASLQLAHYVAAIDSVAEDLTRSRQGKSGYRWSRRLGRAVGPHIYTLVKALDYRISKAIHYRPAWWGPFREAFPYGRRK